MNSENPSPNEVQTETDETTPEPEQIPQAQGDVHPRSLQSLHDILSVVGVFIAALVLAWGLISFVFQSYEVNGSSMETTLQNNDHLVVWKVSRTWARITKHAYVPHRGDVIIFNEPNLSDFGQSNDKQLVKRVIGLPGERVVVKNDVIAIYNKQHPNGFDPDKTLGYGKVIPATSGNLDLTLGPNQIFVCGDNRPDSLDSRLFGPVDLNNVVGKLMIRVLPLNKAKVF